VGLPLLAGIGATPRRWAKAASECSPAASGRPGGQPRAGHQARITAPGPQTQSLGEEILATALIEQLDMT
jgi:hypothetical protein